MRRLPATLGVTAGGQSRDDHGARGSRTAGRDDETHSGSSDSRSGRDEVQVSCADDERVEAENKDVVLAASHAAFVVADSQDANDTLNVGGVIAKLNYFFADA